MPNDATPTAPPKRIWSSKEVNDKVCTASPSLFKVCGFKSVPKLISEPLAARPPSVVSIATSPVKVVSELKCTPASLVVTFPAVKIPLAPKRSTAPSASMVPALVIVKVPKPPPKPLAVNETAAISSKSSVSTKPFNTMVSVTIFKAVVSARFINVSDNVSLNVVVPVPVTCCK